MFSNQGFGNNNNNSNSNSSNSNSSNNNNNGYGSFGGFGGGGFNPFFGGLNNFGGSNQQQQDNRTPEEKYATQLQQLEAMGFTNKQVNIEALKKTGGNVDAAVDRIFNMLG